MQLRVRLWFAVGVLLGIGLLLGWAWLQDSQRTSTGNGGGGTSKKGPGEDPNGPQGKGKSAGNRKVKVDGGESPKDDGPERTVGEPWSHLHSAAIAPRFEDVCFDDFPLDQLGPEIDETRRWLTGVDPQRARVSQNRGQPPLVEGLARLRAPWLEQAALRLCLRSQQQFKIHVYSGNQGVSLYYYQNPRPSWAAYATRRKPNTPRPQLLAYIGSDNDRYARSGWGTFSLHYDDGQLVMTRGSARILSVPLADRPDEVFFDGRTFLRGITMFRCGPVPPEEAARPLVLKSDKPAKLPWGQNLPRGARLERHEDGRLELTSRKTSSDAVATLPIREPGLYEVLLQVEDPQPGTGIFLGDADGRLRYRVGFFREERSNGSVVFGFAPPGDNRESMSYDPERQPTPLVGQTQWFRLVLGMGSFKCWTSGDGRYWARIPQPIPRGDNLRSYGSLGLYCLRGNAPRRIALRHVEIRELSAITSLATAEAREKAVPMDRLPDLPAWLQAVAEGQPPNVGPDDWRRACAIRTLATSPSPGLAKSILEALLREGIEQGTPVEDRLRLLQEAGLLWDATQQQDKDRFDRLYNHLAEALLREGHPELLETIAPALVRSTIWSPSLVQIIPARAAWGDFLTRVNGQQWPEVLQYRWQFDYWHRTGHYLPTRNRNRNNIEQWIDWGAAVAKSSRGRGVSAVLGGAEDRTAKLAGRQKIPPMQSEWRHPLIEKISKAGFSVLAELEASVDGQSYEDACQIISTANPQAALGLLPDGKDPQLMVSLPSAVALAIQTHPGLRQAMSEKLAPLGKLRVREAKLAGDTATIRAATVQFFGTEAAAEAHHWLGDQALTAGDADSAIGHYTRALQRASLASRGQLSAMLRLASAMAGRQYGQPVEQPVTFGGSRLSPPEFEQLVSELRSARQSGGPSSAGSTISPPHQSAGTAPSPTRFESEPWGEFQGTRVPSQSNVDWAGRQTRAVVAGNLMLISDGQKLDALELANGKLKWSKRGNRTLTANGHWYGVSASPTVAGQRVYVRRGGRRGGGEIACLALDDGKELWTKEPRSASDGGLLISDPLLVGGNLFAFSAIRGAGNSTLELRLLSIHPDSGQLLAQLPLVQLRDYWSGRPPCDAMVANDLILANVGGCVVCCDAVGAAKWVRRLTRLPERLPQFGDSAIVQHREPPLVVGRRVYVTQRDVRAVECLDLETGRLHWRQVLPDVRRVLGVAAGHVVVESAVGLYGFDAGTGEFVWHRPMDFLLEARMAGGEQPLMLYARAETLPGNKHRPVLAWLDPRSGRDVATCPVGPPEGQRPLVGPLVAGAKRTWLLAGKNPTNGHRLINELLPKGKPLGGQPSEPLLEAWLPHVDARLRRDVAGVLPGWTLIASGLQAQTGWHDERENQRDVVVTMASGGQPARMLRRVTIPRNGRAKLLIHVGTSGQTRWELEVSASGKSLFRSQINGWLRREIDLTPLAGQTVWLSANHRSTNRNQSFANWQQLEVKTQ